jgi:hypothetical protein
MSDPIIQQLQAPPTLTFNKPSYSWPHSAIAALLPHGHAFARDHTAIVAIAATIIIVPHLSLFAQVKQLLKKAPRQRDEMIVVALHAFLWPCYSGRFLAAQWFAKFFLLPASQPEKQNYALMETEGAK